MKYIVYRSDYESIEIVARNDDHAVEITLTLSLEDGLRLAKDIKDQCERPQIKR